MLIPPRWSSFVQWAQNNRYVVSLYRVKNPATFHHDFRIRLTLEDKTSIEAVAEDLDEALDTIKEKLLALKLDNQG